MKRRAAREYEAIASDVSRARIEESAHLRARQHDDAHGQAHRDASMRAVVDALWVHLHDHGVAWVGFYLDVPSEAGDRRMMLGPCRDKPACSPIGLHGVCGQALRSKTTRIVRDVRDLGPHYIACDPRDRSEIVIPLTDEHGQCWGVLDLDSHEIGSFDDSDDIGLQLVLAAAGLLKLDWAEKKQELRIDADERHG